MRKGLSFRWILGLVASLILAATLILAMTSVGFAIDVKPTGEGEPTVPAEGAAGELAEEGEAQVYNTVFASNIVAAFPELQLSVEDVEALRASGMGWGEIVIAASLAQASGKNLDEVIAMFNEGLGWGKIAKELGVETKGLGHAVSDVLGKEKQGTNKNKPDGDALEEIGIQELLAANFGLSDSDIAELAQAGMKKRDLLIALSTAAASGDPRTFEAALALRQEGRSWQEALETLGIDPRGVRDMKSVLQRSEFREQIRERLKEFQEERKEHKKEEKKGQPKGKEPGEGNLGKKGEPDTNSGDKGDLGKGKRQG